MNQVRQLGLPITLKECMSKMSKDAIYEHVLMPLWQNGTVCIKQQNLSPAQLKEISTKMGSSMVLPKAFSFNNRDPEHPEIVKVGNINPDGSIRKGVNDAEYWHHDGNFWPAPQNQILNMLHAKIVPSQGGQTGFLDMVKPIQDKFFSQQQESRLRDSTLLVQTKNISDFKNAPAEDQMPDQIHPVIKKHSINGEDSMYLPRNPDGLYNSKTKQHWISNEAVWEQLIQGGYFYGHKWTVGDVLLWDNMQVQHRSMGGYGDEPRSLYRVQARYNELNKEDFYPSEQKLQNQNQQASI